ncbi:MAG TPA: dCMP deaminase family protein [Castellaniella sp.]|nr:dCMP deaminase family protein [Castellaniella sp.]
MTKWDKRFLDLARHVATWSRDPSTQVGCVIVNPRRQIVSTGFNGFPVGVDDDPARYADRPTKYLMILHAEQNAVLQAGGDVRGGTAYVTHPPCSQCAAVLIQAGIVRIVTVRPDAGMADRFRDSFEAAEVMLREAGVEAVAW